jgi:hypothetical protein
MNALAPSSQLPALSPTPRVVPSRIANRCIRLERAPLHGRHAVQVAPPCRRAASFRRKAAVYCRFARPRGRRKPNRPFSSRRTARSSSDPTERFPSCSSLISFAGFHVDRQNHVVERDAHRQEFAHDIEHVLHRGVHAGGVQVGGDLVAGVDDVSAFTRKSNSKSVGAGVCAKAAAREPQRRKDPCISQCLPSAAPRLTGAATQQAMTRMARSIADFTGNRGAEAPILRWPSMEPVRLTVHADGADHGDADTDAPRDADATFGRDADLSLDETRISHLVP